MRKPVLGVVILHYGDPDLTARIHNQLLAADPLWASQIMVLDNASPTPYPRAGFRLPENIYWGGALEWALSWAAKRDCTHLWFLNNDIYFVSRPPHIERAWKRVSRLNRKHGRLGIYAPAVERNRYHPQMEADSRAQYRLVQVADGIAPMFDLDCVREVGLDIMDNPFGYGVDLALSMNAHKAGWPVVVDHQVRIRHIYHSTARRVEGFLDIAARAQDAYMAAKLGPDWRSAVEAAQSGFEDHDQL
jgi:GT2 family glycosyltransferase